MSITIRKQARRARPTYHPEPGPDIEYEDSTYGPMARLADFPGSGPIFLSAEGHARWVADGRPKILPPAKASIIP